MLDKPEKTSELLDALRAALPFEVELAPELIARLRAETPSVVVTPQQVVSQVSYAGDEGGVMCHILPKETAKDAVIVSLTYLRMSRKNPLAAAVFDYQKHRMKKLKKRNGP
jgi:hypothetical protein